MPETNRDLIRRFFVNLNRGTPDEALFAPGWTVWSLSTREDGPGLEDLEANRLLMSLFPDRLVYTVGSILVDGDNAAARVAAEGTLGDGETYCNDYVFLFELREGRIARIEEFYDTEIVARQILPPLMAAIAAGKG
jgi:ketosteroid isomerase-like protein